MATQTADGFQRYAGSELHVMSLDLLQRFFDERLRQPHNNRHLKFANRTVIQIWFIDSCYDCNQSDNITSEAGSRNGGILSFRQHYRDGFDRRCCWHVCRPGKLNRFLQYLSGLSRAIYYCGQRSIAVI